MPKATCPCCGQAVRGPHKGNAALGAGLVRRLIDEAVKPTHARLVPVVNEATRSEMAVFVADGERLYGQLLDHVHGRARPGTTPDMREMTRLVGAYSAGVDATLDWAAGVHGVPPISN